MTAAALRTKRDEILARCDVVRTTYGDKSVEYAELSKTLAVLDAEIVKADVAAGTTTRIRQIRLYSDKGF